MGDDGLDVTNTKHLTAADHPFPDDTPLDLRDYRGRPFGKDFVGVNVYAVLREKFGRAGAYGASMLDHHHWTFRTIADVRNADDGKVGARGGGAAGCDALRWLINDPSAWPRLPTRAHRDARPPTPMAALRDEVKRLRADVNRLGDALAEYRRAFPCPRGCGTIGECISGVCPVCEAVPVKP